MLKIQSDCLGLTNLTSRAKNALEMVLLFRAVLN